MYHYVPKYNFIHTCSAHIYLYIVYGGYEPTSLLRTWSSTWPVDSQLTIGAVFPMKFPRDTNKHMELSVDFIDFGAKKKQPIVLYYT